MKKVVLSLVFMGTFMFANAITSIAPNCHTSACHSLDGLETALALIGESLSAQEADAAYLEYYNTCAME